MCDLILKSTNKIINFTCIEEANYFIKVDAIRYNDSLYAKKKEKEAYKTE